MELISNQDREIRMHQHSYVRTTIVLILFAFMVGDSLLSFWFSFKPPGIEVEKSFTMERTQQNIIFAHLPQDLAIRL